jgi:hypothetical protein
MPCETQCCQARYSLFWGGPCHILCCTFSRITAFSYLKWQIFLGKLVGHGQKKLASSRHACCGYGSWIPRGSGPSMPLDVGRPSSPSM